MTDAAKLTGVEYDNQIQGALLDYLPQTSQKSGNQGALSTADPGRRSEH